MGKWKGVWGGGGGGVVNIRIARQMTTLKLLSYMVCTELQHISVNNNFTLYPEVKITLHV